MNRTELKNQLQFFLSTTSGHNLEGNIEKFLDVIELEHRKAMRPFCVSLAEIGVAVCEQATDTMWVGPAETIVERIFSELGIDMDCRDGGPLEQLKDFIKFEVKPCEKQLEAKSNELAQLELNLKNTT